MPTSNQHIPFLDLRESNAECSGRLIEAAARVIESGRFLGGDEPRLFEQELAGFCGSPCCIGVSNGLDAIRLILRAWMQTGRLNSGDEVIVAANTYIASILPIIELGLSPVLAPPSPVDFNLDFSRVEEFITPATRAVMLVHLYGSPCWDAEVCRRLHDRGILLIEDNAQAIGAHASAPGIYGNHLTGALGDAAAISFYPTKNLGALGDGGAVLTHDPELASTIRALANYGADRRYHNIHTGYNNRLDEIQAAFLRVKLPMLDAENARRAQIAATYDRLIRNPFVKRPAILSGSRQVWHQYVIRSPRRDELRNHLEAHGVGTDIHYAVPPHLQPCLKGKFHHPSLRLTEQMADTLLSLPIANINETQAHLISNLINEFN
mgnify:CR=1 FL=1